MDTWITWGKFLERPSVEAVLYGVLLFEIGALLSVPSVLLKRRGRPLSALTWLFALIAMPVVGFLAWWAFGRTRIERRLRPHVQRKKAYVRRHGAPRTARQTRFDPLLPERARGEYAFFSEANRIQLLTDGKSAFAAMEKELSAATHSIHLLFYIFKLDDTGNRLCALLAERARAGVEVRVLVDGFGSQATVRRLRRCLEGPNVRLGVFLPSRLWPLHSPRFNFINHRKILVVDNRIAFSGGMNIGREYEDEWRDLMLRAEGPSVQALNHIFLEDWYFSTGEAITDPLRASDASGQGCGVAIVSSGPDTEAWIHDAYFMAMTRTEKRLWLVTPYFIPTAAILTALRTAAGRGVDVRLIVPRLSDVKVATWASRSYYGILLAAGVRIFESHGPMLHAKAMVLDDFCAVGTVNIDQRSMRLNFEVCAFVDDPAVTRQLATWMLGLAEPSEEMSQERLARVAYLQSLGESVAHLLSPLL